MPTPPHRFAYGLLYVVFRVLATLLCRLEVQLPSNLPTRGPLIIATNHLHVVDPCMVMLGLRYSHITVLAGEKWAESWPVSWLIKTAGGIFVNRGEVDRVALEKCLAVLRDGGILGLAPEGTRSRTGALQRGKPGVAYIAIKAGVPILPIGISGQEKLAASWKRLRRAHIIIRVGEPFWLDPVEGRQKGQQLQARSDEVMCRIAALVREDLRGVYADATGNTGRAESTA